MLTACWVIGVLMTGLALVWILRGFIVAPPTELTEIDVIAFRNVLSLEDNHVLRQHLSEGEYRQLKRARVRAAQEYVKAIAANCAATIGVLRARVPENSPAQREVSSVVNEALRIRLLCLGFWLALWVEFLLPNLEIRPIRIAGGYERLHSAAERCLRSGQTPSAAL
ncbi:MAG TPA: hypothetical protein VFU50_03260 [Terriglobales bacterium]|nr:hypothetical protein [Terriglobales bacterium]